MPFRVAFSYVAAVVLAGAVSLSIPSSADASESYSAVRTQEAADGFPGKCAAAWSVLKPSLEAAQVPGEAATAR